MTAQDVRKTGFCAHQAVRPIVALIVAALTALVLVALAHFSNLYDWVKAPDAWSYDWRTAHFSAKPDTTRPDILVVTIDETSLELYPWNSPVNRELTAKLVAGIEAAGAKAIGLDFLYDKATTREDDSALIAALSAAKIPVVLGAVDKRSVLRDRDPSKALSHQEEFIARSGHPAGHLYFFSSERNGRFNVGDQVVRRRIGPSPEPPNRRAFAALLAEKAGGIGKLQSLTEPRLIDWQGQPKRGLERHPVPELRVGSHRPGSDMNQMFGEGWEKLVQDRIVLIGGSFKDRDRHLTPFSVINSETMSGVFIHAQILAQLIDGREVLTLPIWLESALLALLVLAGWSLSRRHWSLPGRLSYRVDAGGIAETVSAGFFVFLAGVIVYAGTGYIIPSVTIFLAFLMGLSLGNPPNWLSWLLARFVP